MFKIHHRFIRALAAIALSTALSAFAQTAGKANVVVLATGGTIAGAGPAAFA